MQARRESDVKLNALEASKVAAKVVQALEASKEAGREAEASKEDLEDFLRMRRMITDGQTGYIPCSAKESSRAAIRVAIVASVSSPMFEMRKVLPFSLP